MIRGVTVSVELRQRGARDEFGNDVESYGPPVEVDDVLVEGGAASELDATRPEGVKVAYTLRFPKAWTDPMRGARVELPAPFDWGNPYTAIGALTLLIDANVPGRWNGVLEVEATDG